MVFLLRLMWLRTMTVIRRMTAWLIVKSYTVGFGCLRLRRAVAVVAAVIVDGDEAFGGYYLFVNFKCKQDIDSSCRRILFCCSLSK